MYAPQYPTKGQTPTGPTPHIHAETETLSDHENAQNFKLYLNGRASAYHTMISEATDKLERAQKTQKAYTSNPHLWTLAEGQIEALKEILETLKKAQYHSPKER